MDSRTRFNNTWLTEMPENIGNTDLYNILNYTIQNFKTNGKKIEHITDSFKKIEGLDIVYYWYENTNGEILLGAEFDKKPQSLIVNMIGKKYKGTLPYASDLYNGVLSDRNSYGVNSIRIMSDKALSEEGFKIWSILLKQGHKISIYSKEEPGISFKTINSEEELNQYFGKDDSDFRNYQYVLTENSKLVETKSVFNTRRMRELSGLL